MMFPVLSARQDKDEPAPVMQQSSKFNFRQSHTNSLVPEEDYAIFQLNVFKILVVYAQYPYEFKGLSRHQQC